MELLVFGILHKHRGVLAPWERVITELILSQGGWITYYPSWWPCSFQIYGNMSRELRRAHIQAWYQRTFWFLSNIIKKTIFIMLVLLSKKKANIYDCVFPAASCAATGSTLPFCWLYNKRRRRNKQEREEGLFTYHKYPWWGAPSNITYCQPRRRRRGV